MKDRGRDIAEGASPLVIIGAGRSGTNMLRDCLTRLDGVVTWPCDEINYVWRHGNRDHPTDELTVAHARPSVRRFIRARFSSIADRQGDTSGAGDGRRIVVEKTCANSLRVPFVDAILPEARYVYLVRDGRDVVASASRRWKAALDLPYILAKARYVPLSDVPYYGARYALNRARKLLSGNSTLSVWGPRYEGMREHASSMSLEAVCAAQWARCVDLSDAAFDAIEPERVLRLRYEDFVAAPSEQLARIGRFAALELSASEIEAATADVRSSSVGKAGKSLPPDALGLMRETLERHEYA